VLDQVLSQYTHGEKVQSNEGSLTRMCEKMFLTTLVEEHNQPGGKHLELHWPIFLEYQFEKNVTFANLTTPFLLLHPTRAVNSGWPLQLGFNATGRLANAKFEYLGIATNSLRSKANPVCLAMANKECADAYEHTYQSMEAGVFQLVHSMHLCKPTRKCEMCDSVQEQIEQEPMKAELTPPKKKKSRGEPTKKKFSLPLTHPLCYNQIFEIHQQEETALEQKLESRTKGTRRPSAWAPENEDVEDSDEPTRKQHWCPVTVASDDMELVPLQLKKVAVKAFLPANIYLTHFFFCITCEREL
jgi:hypothetical protein